MEYIYIYILALNHFNGLTVSEFKSYIILNKLNICNSIKLCKCMKVYISYF